MATEHMTVSGDNLSSATYGIGYGLNPNQASKNLFASAAIAARLDEPVGALDPTEFGYFQSKISPANPNPGYMDFTFVAPPSAVIINSVKLMGYLRTSQAGSNQFNANPSVFGHILPSGCSHTAGAGTQHDGSTVSVTNNLNTNTKPPGGFDLYTLGTWATNPHTAAAWAISELAAGALFAGVKANSPNIPYSLGSSQNSFDIGQLYLELDVTPAESVYGPAKWLAAALLRLRRLPLRIVEFEVAGPLADVEPGQIIWVVDRLYPTADGEGVSIANWDRRPIHVLDATYNPGRGTATVRGLDMRAVYCSFWSTFRTDLGVTATYSGIPHYDRGGGYTHERKLSGGTEQAAWAWQPGDYLFANLAAGKVRFSPWGLVIVGGEYDGSAANTGEHTWGPTYNTFSGGSGTTFTGWTPASNGAGGTLAEDTSTILFDLDGYRRAPKLTNGATASDFEYLYQDWAGFTANHRCRYFVKFSVHGETEPDAVGVLLRRTSDSYDWVPGTGFVSGGSWNYMTEVGDGSYGYGSFIKVGNHYEYWSDEVQVGATTSLRLHVGHVNAGGGSVTIHAAGIVHNNAATATKTRRVIRRDFVPTVASVIEQAADIYTLTNATDYKFVDEQAGFVSFVFIPFFAHLDLDDAHHKRLLTIMHDLANLDFHRVYYHRLNSTTAYLDFQRVRASGDVGIARFTLTGSNLAAYMTPMKVAARWVGADLEHGLANRTLSVFLGGVKGTDVVASNDCRYDGSDSEVRIGGGSDTPTINQFAEGAICDLEFWKGRCPSDIEVARIHAGSGLNLNLPTILNP